MAKGNRPAHQIRLGAITATIWFNEKKKTGEPYFTVTLSRSYRVNEQFVDSSKFYRDDLPVAVKAIEMAYTWLWEQPAPSDPEVIE